MIPRTSLSQLRITPFSVDPGIDAFVEIITEVRNIGFVHMPNLILPMPQTFVTSTAPFDIGTEVFKHLLTTYETLDRSVDALISRIQYMYMTHFFRQPLSLLASDSRISENLTEHVAGRMAPYLRALPSWQDITDQRIADTISSLNESDEDSAALREALAIPFGDDDGFQRCFDLAKEDDGDGGVSFADVQAGTLGDLFLLHLVAHRYRNRARQTTQRRLALDLLNLLCEAWAEKARSSRTTLEGLWKGENMVFAREMIGLVKCVS